MKYTIKLSGSDIYAAIYKELASQAIEHAEKTYQNGLDRHDYLLQVLRGTENMLMSLPYEVTVAVVMPERRRWPDTSLCMVTVSAD